MKNNSHDANTKTTELSEEETQKNKELKVILITLSFDWNYKTLIHYHLFIDFIHSLGVHQSPL